MSALAERIELRLRQLPPNRVATLERLIANLLDAIEPEAPPGSSADIDATRRAEALAALERIASRGGIAGIGDPADWQKEQRIDRALPGRDA